jgi:hypothetical protein
MVTVGCGTEVTAPHRETLNVSWLEWPTRVSPGGVDSMRILGPRFCDLTFSFSVDTPNYTTNYTNLTLTPEATTFPCDTRPFPLYDTTVALPQLATNLLYTILAPVADVPDRIAMRGFGTMNVQHLPRPDTSRHVGGLARLVADTAGCVWAEYRSDLRYLVLNRPSVTPLNGQTAFVGAHVQPNASGYCGVTHGIYLDFAELRVSP